MVPARVEAAYAQSARPLLIIWVCSVLSPGRAVVTFRFLKPGPTNNTNSTTATAGHRRQEKQEEWMLKVVLDI